MEKHSQSFFSADDANYLARAEAADRANEYLYRVLDIGQYMLQSGAEISRVEDSIRRLCTSFGAERTDVFTITSSIIVTIYAPQFGAVTQTRRVGGQQYDLHRLELLNQLSRRICTQYLSLEETEAALSEIRDTPQYPFGVQLLTYALISASFSLFFGGSAMDAVASGLIGVILRYLDRIIRRLEANAFLSALICSCLGSAGGGVRTDGPGRVGGYDQYRQHHAADPRHPPDQLPAGYVQRQHHFRPAALQRGYFAGPHHCLRLCRGGGADVRRGKRL